jgi:RNA polymerase sigma-70 factor (ECF subfamily)
MADFHQLIEQQIPRLRRYARALTRNPERADDLVQDTMVRALAKQHFWQPGTNIRAWLFTLMHNQNVNTVPRAIREGVSVDMEGLSSPLIATTDPTASRKMFELERAIGQVPLEQRQVVLLVSRRHVICGEPLGTVRSRLSRGRDSLRRLMDVMADARRLDTMPALAQAA